MDTKPDWLDINKTLNMLGFLSNRECYKLFVLKEKDYIKEIYKKSINLSSIG
jgi:hypothetical protein